MGDGYAAMVTAQRMAGVLGGGAVQAKRDDQPAPSSRFLSMTGTRLVEPAGERTQLTFLGTGHTRGLLKPLEPLLATAAGGHRLQTQLARLKQCLETRPLRTCRGYHRPASALGAAPPRRATQRRVFRGFAAPARRQMRMPSLCLREEPDRAGVTKPMMCRWIHRTLRSAASRVATPEQGGSADDARDSARL